MFRAKPTSITGNSYHNTCLAEARKQQHIHPKIRGRRNELVQHDSGAAVSAECLASEDHRNVQGLQNILEEVNIHDTDKIRLLNVKNQAHKTLFIDEP